MKYFLLALIAILQGGCGLSIRAKQEGTLEFKRKNAPIDETTPSTDVKTQVLPNPAKVNIYIYN